MRYTVEVLIERSDSYLVDVEADNPKQALYKKFGSINLKQCSNLAEMTIGP